jgi:hypothetical protein
LTKREASPLLQSDDVAKILTRVKKNLDGGYAMAGLLGHGDSLYLEIQQEYVPLIFIKMMK